LNNFEQITDDFGDSIREIRGLAGSVLFATAANHRD